VHLKANYKSIKEWTPALCCLVFSFFCLAFLSFSPSGNEQLAVVFPIGTIADESFVKTVNSGAYATGEGMFENIVLFRADKNSSSQVIDQLYRNGALVVVSAIGAGGCFSRPK